MKKYVRIILTISIFFIILDVIFSLFSRNKVVNYNVSYNGNSYEVLEDYQKGDGYYFEIKFDDYVFNFVLEDIFNNNSYVLDMIYSFKNDSYTCIFPVFNNKEIHTDILCNKKDIIYPYRSIRNESLEVDRFATSMKEYGYQLNKSSDKSVSKNGIKVFNDNLYASHIITIPSSKGVHIITSSKKNAILSIEIFDKEVYSQKIHGIVSDYYVVADYNENYSFNVFYVLNLKNNKISKIISDVSISMDSYVQGVIDNAMYIMDRSNKKQYKIDVFDKTVVAVGNTKKGIIYYNGDDYEYRSVYDAINDELFFQEKSIKSNKYDFVYFKNHIYYSYLKNDGGYNLYLSYENNPSIYTFAFSADDVKRINYIDDYIYYVDGDNLYCYNPMIGSLKIISYSEFQYNKNIQIGIYKN